MQNVRFINNRTERLFGVQDLHQHADGLDGKMQLGKWALGPDGRVSLAALGVFADELLGYALMSSLSPGEWSVSTELWLDVVGELPEPGCLLTGYARSVQPGSFAAGELRDDQGRVVVECRQRGRHLPGEDRDERAEPDAPTGDELGVAGMEELLGLRAEGDGVVMLVLPELLNPRRMMHGGVSLAASEIVATRSRIDHGSDLRTTSVQIVHARGVAVGESVVFHAETRHSGRSLWVTDVIGAVGGRTCTVARVSAGPVGG